MKPSLRRVLALIVGTVLITTGGTALAGAKRIVYVGDAGERFESDGHAGWLGVQIDAAGDGGQGARVESVIDDSPADHAGLLAGDVILEFDGRPTADASELSRQVREQEPGSRVTLTVLRDGHEVAIDAEIGDLGAMIEARVGKELEGLGERLEGMHEHLSDMGRHFEHLGTGVFVHECEEGDCREMAWKSARWPMLGVSLTQTTPDLRRHLGGNDDAGALVGRVVPDSAADAAGIEVGDLIVALDGSPVAGAGDIRRALVDRGGQTIRVDVVRNRAPLTLQATLPELDLEDDEPVLRRVGPVRGPRT